jgi:hypothetical protein
MGNASYALMGAVSGSLSESEKRRRPLHARPTPAGRSSARRSGTTCREAGGRTGRPRAGKAANKEIPCGAPADHFLEKALSIQKMGLLARSATAMLMSRVATQRSKT